MLLWTVDGREQGRRRLLILNHDNYSHLGLPIMPKTLALTEHRAGPTGRDNTKGKKKTLKIATGERLQFLFPAYYFGYYCR